MSNSSPNNHLSSPFEIWRRHRKAIVLWPLVCFILAGLFYTFWPRTYQSEARLFLRVGRESVGIDPAATTGTTMPLYTSDRKDEVRSAQEVFRSRTVAANVVDKLTPDVILAKDHDSESSFGSVVTAPIRWVKGIIAGLDPISDREAAIITVEKSLFVGGEPQATVIVLKYSARSPHLAQQVCRAIVDAGQEQYMRVHRSAESTPFFVEQQARLREQLDQSLEELRKAKSEMGLSSIDQRRETLETQFRNIELDRLTTNQQLANSQASIENLYKQLAEIPERLVTARKSMPNQGADLLRDRLYQLQMRSAELQSRYNESHPLVIAVNDQLKEAESVVNEQAEQREETTDEINPVYRELSLAMKREQSTVAGLKARLASLEEQKTAVLTELRNLNAHEVKIDQLTRYVELARVKYMQYAQTMEEARIDQELQQENINNLSRAQEATLAEKPVSPSKQLTAAGAICLAFGGLFGLVLLGELRSLPVSSVHDDGQTVRGISPRRKRRRALATAGKTNGHSMAAEIPPLPK